MEPTEAPIPGLAAYMMMVRIVNLAENFVAPKKGSKEYEDLVKTITNSFAGVLNRKPGYHKLSVENLEEWVYYLNIALNMP